MDETPNVLAGKSTNGTRLQAAATSRGLARALVQKRIAAAKKDSGWASAMRMASGMASDEARPQEIEVSALDFLEKGVFSVSDLFRLVGKQVL